MATVKNVSKNLKEYKGREIDVYPHLRGYYGYYKVGRKMFTLLREAKAYIDTLPNNC